MQKTLDTLTQEPLDDRDILNEPINTYIDMLRAERSQLLISSLGFNPNILSNEELRLLIMTALKIANNNLDIYIGNSSILVDQAVKNRPVFVSLYKKIFGDAIIDFTPNSRYYGVVNVLANWTLGNYQ